MLQYFSADVEFILDNPAKNVFAPSPNFVGPVKENLKKNENFRHEVLPDT